MGKTSAAVKNRYAAKAYDRINLTVKKGKKDEITAHAQSKGESVNGFINRVIDEAIEREAPLTVKEYKAGSEGWVEEERTIE